MIAIRTNQGRKFGMEENMSAICCKNVSDCWKECQLFLTLISKIEILAAPFAQIVSTSLRIGSSPYSVFVFFFKFPHFRRILTLYSTEKSK